MTEQAKHTPGRRTTEHMWKEAAEAAGWTWSPAHNGYINEGELDPYDRARHYWVADDAREACDRSGIETEAQALDAIAGAAA